MYNTFILHASTFQVPTCTYLHTIPTFIAQCTLSILSYQYFCELKHCSFKETPLNLISLPRLCFRIEFQTKCTVPA